MRSLIVAASCLVGAFGFGCGGTDAGPTLSITPSGMAGSLTISAPTEFSAVLVNSSADVSWTVTGGTLSSTAGLHVVYTPPLGTGAGSVTATAGGMTASVQIMSKPATITSKTIPGLSQSVTVAYDAQDVPHIKCATTNDCIAVQGYLQARDRLFPMDFLRHVARSKLTELIGADGLSQDIQLRNLFVTRDGKRLEGELTKVLDATSMALMNAYVNGVNAYIGELTSAAQLPAEYAQLPFPLTPADIEPWTIQDTMALSRLQQFQLSETLNEELAFGQFAQFYGPKDPGKINAWIRAAAPKTEQAHTLETTPFHPPASLASASAGTSARPPAARSTAARLAPWKDALAAASASIAVLHDRLRPADATVGSNNWVVAGAKSATGFAMVANDPHLSLQYPPLFHLAVLTSTTPSDKLDLAGGSFPGIPGALVGRGAHVGWGVTVVGYDVTDVYSEQFMAQAACPGGAAGPPCVVFNGGLVSTIPVPQTFRIRNGAGPIAAHSTTTTMIGLVVPHHGPIIRAPDAGGKALSVRWTGHEGNTQDLKAFLGLNTAANVDEAITALKDFSTGAQNFVLADDQGNIAYDPHALVPRRDKFTDITKTQPWLPVPGDGTAEWGDGVSNCAAAGSTPVPASCWIADDALPQGKNPAKGYFFTANADPIGTTDDNNPLGHLPYLSFSWDDSSGFRATRIEQMLEAAIADHAKVKIEDMEAIQSDHVSRPGMVFTAIIDRIVNPLPMDRKPAELVAAQGILDQWAANGWDCPSGLLGTDPKASPIDPTVKVVQSSSGCFLFHEFLRVLLTNVFTDDLALAKQSVNGLQAIKAMIYMLDGATPPGDQGFCNDVDATGTKVVLHSCDDQVVTALGTAFKTLSAQVSADPTKWVWGRVHTIKPVSLLQLVTNGFEPGPYARPGGAFTVDVGSPSLSGAGLDFVYGSGGNVRHISLMDPAKPTVKMQLPGPERDGPTGIPGPDLLGQWVKNLYFDYAFGNQIDGVAVSTQTFSAQ